MRGGAYYICSSNLAIIDALLALAPPHFKNGLRKRLFIFQLQNVFSVLRMTLKNNEKQVLLTFDLPVGNIKVTVDNSFTDVSCVRIFDGKLEYFDLEKPFLKNTDYMLMARQANGPGIIRLGA